MRYTLLVVSLITVALAGIVTTQQGTIRAKNQLLSQTQQSLNEAKRDFARLKEILEFERASIDKARQEADSMRQRNGWITLEAVDNLMEAQERFKAITDSLVHGL